MQVVGGIGLELGNEVQVEAARLGGLGMHEQAATADVVRELDDTGEDVLKQAGAEPGSLVRYAHTEPSEQCTGGRVTRGQPPTNRDGFLRNGQGLLVPSCLGEPNRQVVGCE